MPRRVRGVLAVEDSQTGDGRVIAAGALTWVDPPLPLAWLVDGDQHVMPTEAPQIGIIETITRDGNSVAFTGQIDDAQPDGAEAVRRMEAGTATNGGRFGVSIDPDDYTVEIVDRSGDTDEVVLVSAAGDADPTDGEVVMEDSSDSVIERYTALRIRGATLCAVAAFAEAYVELDDDAAEPAPVVEGEPVAASAEHACSCQATRVVDRSLVAAGSVIPIHPPSAWFADPQFGRGGEDPRLVLQDEGFWACPFEDTDEGRVFGHIGGPGCHVGYPDRCVRLSTETSRNFADFNVGVCVTADGSRVPVGQITLTGGHASLGLNAQQAAAHYDDTRSGVADIHVGWDPVNNLPWFAGALRPNITDQQLRVLRASGVSGDWRGMNGDPQPRLIAALSVNVPGFGIRRMAARVASGQVQALVAAAIQPRPESPPWAVAVASQERRLAILEAAMSVVLNGGPDAVIASAREISRQIGEGGLGK